MDASKRIERTKLLLMSKANTTFFVSLAFNLPPELITFGTAATDGKKIYFNPDFIKDLDDEELLFLYLHEIMHVVLQHAGRKDDSYDRRLWNVAGDYVINLFLSNAGFKMPRDGLLDSQYEGMSTEEVYRQLVEDNNQQQPDHDDLMEGDSSGNSDSQKEQESGNSGNQLSPGQPGEGNQQVVKITMQKGIPDLIKEAVMAARVSGDLPGTLPPEIERTIKEIFTTQVPWQTLFNKALGGTTQRKTTWLRPKPRYLPIYLPKVKKEGINNLLIAIDVSGSVDKEELATYMGEIYYLLQVSKPRSIELIAFDTDIQLQTKIRNIQQLKAICKKGFPDGGGTSPICVLEYIQDNPVEVAVFFTDGMFYTPSKLHYKKRTRYIWMLTDMNNSYASMGMDNNKLLGEKIYIRIGG